MQNIIPINGLNQLNNPQIYYIHTDDNGSPIILGTGRNAVVFLVRNTESPKESGTEFYAAKFLKDDFNKQYAMMVAVRFYQEIEQTNHFGVNKSFFVGYRGQGVLGALEHWTSRVPNIEALQNYCPAHQKLIKEYFLQGPFYLIELCQGSLFDIMEKASPWLSTIPTYNEIEEYSKTLQQQTELVQTDLNSIINDFMEPDAGTTPLSGYDILNAFKIEPWANRVRNYAVLELFEKIVYTVQQLHRSKLVHRDLKFGNSFIKHGVDVWGFRNIVFKLADLGYMADMYQLSKRHNASLKMHGWRNAASTAPGSFPYRAPEQIQLPMEVRVSFDPLNSEIAFIEGSKIYDIEPDDRLVIGDWFVESNASNKDEAADLIIGRDGGQKGVFQIQDVEKLSDTSYKLKLITDPSKKYSLKKIDDLQAHIIKSTGFHTDGFALGAMLYDLASGGKNPESFYTFCLLRFHQGFGQVDYSIDHIMNVLAPEVIGLSHRGGAIDLEKRELTFRNKLQVTSKVWQFKEIDYLIEQILTGSLELNVDKTQLQEALDNYRFKNFPLVRELLSDRRGAPIPGDILRLIIKCMLRNVDGAFYNSDPEEGYISNSAAAAVDEMHRETQDLLEKKENVFPDKGFPDYFKENLLIKMRMFWPTSALSF